MLKGKLGNSSEDEFTEVDVVIGRYHKVQGKPEADRKSTQTTAKSNAAVKSTPLRRRKLGQGQVVDGSLLKPWGDIATTEGKDTRTSKSRSSRAPIQKANTKSDISSGDASNPLPTTARQTVSRTIWSSTKPVLLPKEKEILNQRSRQKDGHEDNEQASRKLTKKSIPSDESEEESDTIQEIIETSEEEISEFVSISESESDTWNLDSEHSLTPPTRRSRSPTTQWGKPQRTLFRDPGKKAAPNNKQPKATIVDPGKHSPKQSEPKTNILDYFKPSQPGNLEDDFQKLHIFNKDSDSDEPSTKAVKKPVLEPTTPKRTQKTQKTLLASPLKTPRIPASPWKPEHKEFWDPEVNFAWIDEHSPEKPEAGVSEEVTKVKKQNAPGTAKGKPGTSPAKQTRDARRAFDACKENLAQTFLSELDERVTKGQLAQLTRETGGLQIKWSNSLLTTAGRAHWKRTVSTATRHANGTSSPGATARQHSASIELASKVLGNEADLLNTVAHEFCHLAVFMLDGPNTNPNAERGMGEKKKKAAAHGPEFKAWGARCGAIFGDRGIQVTTRHSYEIEYKYIWRCANCGIEVKRHSKSVDTVRSGAVDVVDWTAGAD
ncbi:HMG box-containing protein C19G7.04 [Daldinia childiae]|uniref:HMG box-containing protein C19G7.04 n=1 Tax=Daldinia childiae TaxID=326645 RepID=UPI001444EA86|nr:HMG box-containing protein C19G7.04 [Daldinia childiae]KAF3060000.1 HMG box-containing protein C19G7.04 [Daldinia childiae]